MNTGVVDVAIGLTYVYALFSLICSTVVEAYARRNLDRWLFLRAAIKAMLNDTFALRKVDEEFFRHPVIRALGDNPSYLDARSFGLVVVNLTLNTIPPAGNARGITAVQSGIGPDLATTLQTLLAGTDGSVEHIRERLERWYDESMLRTIGHYTRLTKIRTLIAAVAITLLFNVDSWNIANSLAHESQLARKAAQSALVFVQSAAPSGGTPKGAAAALGELDIPLGWSCRSVTSERGDWAAWAALIFRRLAGLLITILALSLGGPFWFEVLGKIVNVRLAGPKPQAKA